MLENAVNIFDGEEGGFYSLVYPNAFDNEGGSLLPGDMNDIQILLSAVLTVTDKAGQRWNGIV